MRKNFLKYIGFLFVLVCAALPFLTRAPLATPQDEGKPLSRRAIAESLPQVKPAAEIRQNFQQASQQIATGYRKPFRSMPSIRDYRAAVEIDHHATPKILDGFAHEMAREMVNAKQSVTKALELFERLTVCALDDSQHAVEPVRAVCAQNAALLADIYPNDLSHSYRSLHASLDKKIKAALWR